MTLPSEYQDKKDIFYVYIHKDPQTNGIKYVGMGQGQRAWMMRNSGGESPKYGHRSKEHFLWFKELEKNGYTLDQVVEVLYKGLGKQDALLIEKALIEKCNGEGADLFNKDSSVSRMTYPPVLRDIVRKDREVSGLSYKKLSDKYNLKSAMTAWRICNIG